MQATFTDVSAALRLSYAIEAYPASGQSATGSVMRSLMRQCGITEDRRAPMADFGNLSPIEIRAELSRLRDVVKGMHPIVSYTVRARYAQDATDSRQSKVAVANYLRQSLQGILSDFGVLVAMVERHYEPSDFPDPAWSLRALSDRYKISKDRLFRASKLIEDGIGRLELHAFDMLRHELEARDLIAKRGAA